MTVTNEKNEWKATQLRLTIFFAHKFEKSPEDLLPSKDEIEIEKQTVLPKSGETVIEGSYQNNKVILKVLPIRVDLIMETQEKIMLDSPFPIPVVGGFDDSVSIFDGLVRLFLKNDSLYPVKRIAFGIDLINEVPSVEEGYSYLSKLLPFSINSKDSSDFRFQINKPKKSKINKDLKINRLTVWDVIRLNMQLSSLDNDLDYKYPFVYFNHLNLDVNTEAEYKENFGKDIIDSIYKELIQNSIEIAEKGIKDGTN